MRIQTAGAGLALCIAAAPGQPPQEFLGLEAPEPLFLGEGATDPERHPPGTGTLRAILLFARFPDGEEDLGLDQLQETLLPGAVEFFERSSYGRLTLDVDVHERWIDMRGPSTDPGYDCSRHASHRAYVAEVVAAVDEAVDFRPYSLVYVAANKAPGTFNSPTLNAAGRAGILADGIELEHAVTFGNDVRGRDWGWQTLVHETGHVLGLPDLYSYEPAGDAYKNLHRFTGSWDPMGFQSHALHFLAWHKAKLGWLDPEQFEHVERGASREVVLTHIGTETGTKALVLPLSETEAVVAEVRHLSPERSEPGVLFYRVSLTTRSGHGPIRILPARPDDDDRHPELARRYIALYDALYRSGEVFEDEALGIRVEIGAPRAQGFALAVTRS